MNSFTNYAGPDENVVFYYEDLYLRYPGKNFIVIPTDSDGFGWEHAKLLAVIVPEEVDTALAELIAAGHADAIKAVPEAEWAE